MPRGQLPQPTHRHRAKPTTPTTILPAEGPGTPPPTPPPGVSLGAVGRAWWNWAWSLPQAAAWGPGTEATVLMRASLTDELETVEYGTPGRRQLTMQLSQIDDRLGLSPRAMAQLRWSVGEPTEGVERDGDDMVVVSDRWRYR